MRNNPSKAELTVRLVTPFHQAFNVFFIILWFHCLYFIKYQRRSFQYFIISVEVKLTICQIAYMDSILLLRGRYFIIILWWLRLRNLFKLLTVVVVRVLYRLTCLLSQFTVHVYTMTPPEISDRVSVLNLLPEIRSLFDDPF